MDGRRKDIMDVLSFIRKEGFFSENKIQNNIYIIEQCLLN